MKTVNYFYDKLATYMSILGLMMLIGSNVLLSLGTIDVEFAGSIMRYPVMYCLGFAVVLPFYSFYVRYYT